MLDSGIPQSLSEDISLLLDLEGVDVRIIEESYRNHEDDDNAVSFENSSFVQSSTNVHRIEVKITLKKCEYAIHKNRNTTLLLRLDLSNEYPMGNFTIDLVDITNSSSKFKDKCEEILSSLEKDGGVHRGPKLLYNLVYGLYHHVHRDIPLSGSDYSAPFLDENLNVDDSGKNCLLENISSLPSNKYLKFPINKRDTGSVNSYLASHSRYYRDFNHEKVLGSGSFGCVTKVSRDGIHYAVKQIPIYESYGSTLHAEASVLASLQHRNIVRYYDAWVETSPELLIHQSKQQDVLQLSIVKDDHSFTAGKRSSAIEERGSGFKIVQHHPRKMFIAIKDKMNKRKNEVPKKHLFILMEYCGEVTLFELISNNWLHDSQQDIIELLRQILEALAYIHEKGIIHRDIKPSNIFIKTEGDLLVKLGDFGLTAKLTHTSTSKQLHTTGAVGTLHYMAPEHLNDQVYNEKVDIYSAGVVLFEMLSPPFNTSMERSEILSTFSTNNKKFPPGFRERVNPRLFKILETMLSIDPAKRPSATMILQDELFSSSKLDRNSLYQVINQYPHSMESTQLLNGIFSRREAPDKFMDYMMGLDSTPSSIDYLNTELGMIYRREFKARGALRICMPLLVEAKLNDLAPNFNKQPYSLLLSDGKTSQLRLLLLSAFATSMPLSVLIIMRRWYWGLVYIDSDVGRYPKEHWRCAYDIIVDYGIIINDSSIREVNVDAFFTFELISVAIHPLLRFLPRAHVIIEWALEGVVLNILIYGFDLKDELAEKVELLLRSVVSDASGSTKRSGIRDDLSKSRNDYKFKLMDIFRSLPVDSDAYLTSILSFYNLLFSRKSISDFAANVKKLIPTKSPVNLGVVQACLYDLLYMERFFNKINAECIYDPLLPAGIFGKFHFRASLKVGKGVYSNFIIGGCYNSLLSESNEMLQRNVFGFEMDLELLSEIIETNDNITRGTGESFQSPHVMIYISKPTLLIHAKILEHSLGKHGKHCSIEPLVPNSLKRIIKMKRDGVSALQFLQFVILLKFNNNVTNILHTQLQDSIQFNTHDIVNNSKTVCPN